MSPAFQETLAGNELLLNSQGNSDVAPSTDARNPLFRYVDDQAQGHEAILTFSS